VIPKALCGLLSRNEKGTKATAAAEEASTKKCCSREFHDERRSWDFMSTREADQGREAPKYNDVEAVWFMTQVVVTTDY
jgi:hypothetical protein